MTVISSYIQDRIHENYLECHVCVIEGHKKKNRTGTGHAKYSLVHRGWIILPEQLFE